MNKPLIGRYKGKATMLVLINHKEHKAYFLLIKFIPFYWLLIKAFYFMISLYSRLNYFNLTLLQLLSFINWISRVNLTFRYIKVND